MTYSYSIGTEYPIKNNEEVSKWIRENVDIEWNTIHNRLLRDSPSISQMQSITYKFPDIKFYLYFCVDGDLEIYELYNKKVKMIESIERESKEVIGGDYLVTEVEVYPINILFA